MKRSRKQAAAEELGGLALEARRTQRLSTADQLGRGRTPLEVVAVAGRAADLADEAIQNALIRQPPRPPLACKEGCAWCCHFTVGAAVPEVFRIVRYLRESLTPKELLAMGGHVARLAEQRRALGNRRGAAARLPCALLVGDRCSVYGVRPLTCRGCNSSDARECEKHLKPGVTSDIPIYEPQKRLAVFVLDGLRAGLGEAGLKGELLELTAALHSALSVPDAETRWLAGEPIFARAIFPGE